MGTMAAKIYHVLMKKGQIPSHMWGELVKSTSAYYFQLQDTQFKDPILDDVTLRKMTFHPRPVEVAAVFWSQSLRKHPEVEHL